MRPLTLMLGGLFAASGPFASADLAPRLGGAAAYDSALDITWLTDADLSGAADWSSQLDWVSQLNAERHLGFDDWRLASMSVAGGLPSGSAVEVVDCATIWQPLCADNELGYLFYHHLGGASGGSVEGTRVVGDVTFTNIQALYWSGTQSGATNAWMYHFDLGFGVWSPQGGARYAWAVRDGDSPDTDADGIANPVDNCTFDANPDQRDSDADGFGNRCDADLDNDCLVNVVDLGLLRAAFFCSDATTACASADFDGDGVVNVVDLGILRSRFFAAPGPSGVAQGCAAR
ncbi:MAG: thrombospondin type 3 repeat-containing protein [Pseudomonadota bacterium]